ncbi:hypothetical protein LTS14_001945, partial [Recurvomyces mirabilis]|uniref:uncharacterized protein n=1 Tax=Recurvomyces mirabilis TaxID=574656 RepID=UPI002DE02BC8
NIQCSVCGSPFQPPLEHLRPNSNYQEASFSELSTKHLDWLRRLRIIGRNPKTGCAYVSGVGKASTHGWVQVHVGDDPNVPNSRRAEVFNTIDLPTYLDRSSMGGGGEMFANYPVHCICFEMLERVHMVKSPRSTELDVEAIRSRMQVLDSGESLFLRRMQYFELQKMPWEEMWEDGDETRARLVSSCTPEFLLEQ